jgi:hypothetical protein
VKIGDTIEGSATIPSTCGSEGFWPSFFMPSLKIAAKPSDASEKPIGLIAAVATQLARKPLVPTKCIRREIGSRCSER